MNKILKKRDLAVRRQKAEAEMTEKMKGKLG